MNTDNLKATIKAAEAFSAVAYWDVSQYSGGYGHKLPSGEEGKPISLEQAEAWLEDDIRQAVSDTLKVIPDLFAIGETRQEALVEMCYNLGLTRFSKFKKMLGAVERRDWDEAARQAEDSNWFRQVGYRAERLVKALRDG